MPQRLVAVAAVVEQGDAVAGLGEVGEAVGGDLELGRVPAGVAVGRPALDAEGALERRVVGADRQREARLQQDPAVMPVEPGGEVDARRIGPQADRLDDGAGADAAGDPQRPALAAGLDDLDAARPSPRSPARR